MKVNTMTMSIIIDDKYINNWLVTYVFDNPIIGNQIGAEGAKHLKLPENLQTLYLQGKY